MTCECVSKLDEKLKAENVRLNVSYILTGYAAGVYPVMTTEFIEKKRGKKPPVMFPTFCPFCGVKYIQKDEQK